jgi:hypothetical protein
MKKFLIEESEKNQILSMHRLVKEQTKATGPSADLELLRQAVKAGCLKNGKLLSNNAGTKYVYRATTKSGKQVDFFADMTYKFSDGSKTGTWKMCDQAAIDATTTMDNTSKVDVLKKEGWKTLDDLKKDHVDLNTLDKVYDTQNVGSVTLYKMKGIVGDLTPGNSTQQFNQEQLAFIDKYEKKGYMINPPRVDRENMRPITADELGAPSDLFPNGLTLYYNPNKQHNLTTDQSELGADITNQTPPRDVCRQRIEQFYTLYTRRNSMISDPETIVKARNIVQACKDTYYPKKWGILGGELGKLNQYIEILSGDRDGGPGTQGSDKIFRLK